MSAKTIYSEIELVNGSVGDPVLYVDYVGGDNALLFDAGDNSRLPMEKLSDLEAVFISHHHVDHFIGFDRIVRANMDADKAISVFGPVGTIEKVYQRIKSYEYPHFPFQKIVLKVHELLDGQMAQATLECTRRFPPPSVELLPWTDDVIFENDEVRVEAVHVDHTVPCLAYAFVEKPGYHLRRDKLDRGALRPGPWIGEVLARLHADDERESIQIGGGQFRVSELANQYFRKSRGTRVAYVVDTAWSDMSRESLLRLARRASRLYCDCFYAQAQARQAEKHRHMTAPLAGQLAAAAEVDRLILIHHSRRYQGRYELLLEEARAEFPDVESQLYPT